MASVIISVALVFVIPLALAYGIGAWIDTPYEVLPGPAELLGLDPNDVRRELEALDREFPGTPALPPKPAEPRHIPPAELKTWRDLIDPRTDRLRLSSGRVISRERLEDAISGKKPLVVD